MVAPQCSHGDPGVLNLEDRRLAGSMYRSWSTWVWQPIVLLDFASTGDPLEHRAQ